MLGVMIDIGPNFFLLYQPIHGCDLQVNDTDYVLVKFCVKVFKITHLNLLFNLYIQLSILYHHHTCL